MCTYICTVREVVAVINVFPVATKWTLF